MSDKDSSQKQNLQTKNGLEGKQRIDPPSLDPGSLWLALSNSPGVGVSIMDRDGRLWFVNATSRALFFDPPDIEYQGRLIEEIHPPEFVEERLRLIARVLDENRPLEIRHIYLGHRICSSIWPLNNPDPPFGRVIVISRQDMSPEFTVPVDGATIETMETKYIDLGPIDILTKKELEVLAFLGHGMSLKDVARVMHRSPKTIDRHKMSISQKLHLSGQKDMVSIVTSLGLDVSDAHLERMSREND